MWKGDLSEAVVKEEAPAVKEEAPIESPKRSTTADRKLWPGQWSATKRRKMTLVDHGLVGWAQCKRSTYHTKGAHPLRLQPELQAQTLQLVGYSCQVQATRWLVTEFPNCYKSAAAVGAQKMPIKDGWHEVQNEEPFSPLDQLVTPQK